jgi:PAS domain S-box-containing protein
MAEYSFDELVDMDKLQETLDLFTRATGFPLAVLDNNEKILAASGWVDICTKYHRCHPVTQARCRQSDTYIKSHLHEQDFVAYKCQNGLWDIGVPIYIENKHMATLFGGQFFYADDLPDQEFFRKQARECEFDEKEYLAELKSVPVFTRQQAADFMGFFANIAKMLSFNELGNLRLKEEVVERRRAEEDLRKALALMEGLLNAIPDLIFYKDKNSVYQGSNNAFLEYAGTTREELVGHTDFDFFPKDVAEFFREKDRQMFSEGKPRRNEEWIDYPDGRRVLLDTLKIPYFDTDGQLLGMIGVSRDITETKQLEQERIKTANLESISVLAGGIAHDFNNILTAIMGNISLLKHYGGSDDWIKGVLDNAEEASSQAKELAQQLITFSRGGAPIKDVVELVDLLTESTGLTLRGSSVTCKLSLPDDLWMVEADKNQLRQAINNLIINACEAMPDGGTIDLKAENVTSCSSINEEIKDCECVNISIADHGCGIDDAIINKIFDPYFTTKDTGSGLGLATAYSIIKKHGGSLKVKSEPGGGTVFDLYLPAVKRKSKVLDKKDEPSTRKTGYILVMDDEEAVRKVLQRMLEFEGHRVLSACDGEEALCKYGEAMESGEPFDAVILDLTIPSGMGGQQAAARLIELDPDVRVLVSSGYASDPIVANYKEYGFFGAISKPYNLVELNRIISTVLR